MSVRGIISVPMFASLLYSCNNEESKTTPETSTVSQTEKATDTLTKHLNPFKAELPTIGLLTYNGVLQSEVIATSDVFAKPSEAGEQLFNVISIAETKQPITNEEGIAAHCK